MNNDLVRRNLDISHCFNFKESAMLVYEQEKKFSKIVVSSVISILSAIEARLIFVNLSLSLTLYIYIFKYRLIGVVGRVFTNGLGDMGSIPGRVIRKTLKMVLDASLQNTQQYKVRIKGKVEQSRERSSALLYTSV